jgi:RimJ/RimL family protein N-acetyltransferase
MKLIRLTNSPADAEALQLVFENAPRYFQKVTGSPAEKNKAERLLIMLPDGKTLADKFVYAFYNDKALMGCADVIRGYPEAQTALLGLFLLSEQFQDQGFGKKFCQLLEREIKEWNCHKIWLSVVKVNVSVIGFWEKMGFNPTGEIRPYSNNNIISESVLMEKKF